MMQRQWWQFWCNQNSLCNWQGCRILPRTERGSANGNRCEYQGGFQGWRVDAKVNSRNRGEVSCLDSLLSWDLWYLQQPWQETPAVLIIPDITTSSSGCRGMTGRGAVTAPAGRLWRGWRGRRLEVFNLGSITSSGSSEGATLTHHRVKWAVSLDHFVKNAIHSILE